MILKELDAVQFDSLISDPLFRYSDILFAKYPGLRELLAAELQQGDSHLKEIPEEGMQIESVRSKIEKGDAIFTEQVSEPIMSIPQVCLEQEMINDCLDRFGDKNDLLSDFGNKRIVEETILPTVQSIPKTDASAISDERKLFGNAVSLVSDSFDVSDPTAMSGKCVQFRKWLVDSTDAQADAQLELPTFAEVMETDESDIFSDSDEFLDAVEQTSPMVSTPAIPSIQTVTVDTDDHIYETLSHMPLSVSQLSASMASSSCRSSASDLTVDSSASRQRRATHNKGQAPAPPSTSPFIPSSPNNIKAETVGKVPAVVEKEKTFRNFLNYIPNMLKPISPASSTKNLHIETDI